IAGSLMWVTGDLAFLIPGLVLLAALVSHEEAEAKRVDARLDRAGRMQHEGDLREQAAEILQRGVEGDAALGEALRVLRARGVHSIMIEGGARLAGALLFEGLADRLVVFTAPVVLGAGALNAFLLAPAQRAESAPRLRIVRREAFADDLMTVYALDTTRARKEG
ncbi:MAG: RibD family protein, partial [Gemmatimonadota bacterium]